MKVLAHISIRRRDEKRSNDFFFSRLQPLSNYYQGKQSAHEKAHPTTPTTVLSHGQGFEGKRCKPCHRAHPPPILTNTGPFSFPNSLIVECWAAVRCLASELLAVAWPGRNCYRMLTDFPYRLAPLRYLTFSLKWSR